MPLIMNNDELTHLFEIARPIVIWNKSAFGLSQSKISDKNLIIWKNMEFIQNAFWIYE